MTTLTQAIAPDLHGNLFLAQPPSPLRNLCSPWLMWVVTVSFVFFQFFLQLSAGVMLHPLMKSFHLTALGAGFLVSSFYFIYVLLQTPAGMLVDQFGPRRLLGSGGFICALGCFLFAVSHSFLLALIGRLCMGLGASCAFVSSLYLVNQWFPEKRFALMVGLAEAIGMLGTLIGNVYLATLLSHTSWRITMLFAAGIALLLGGLCYLIVRDKPKHEISQMATPATFIAFQKEVIWIIRHRGLWLNGIYAGLLFSVVTVFAALWALPYLSLTQKVALPLATVESALVFVGIVIGSPIMGYLYTRIQNKNRFLALMSFLAALISSLIIYVAPVSVRLSSGLFLLLGLVCSSYVFNYSIASQIVPKTVRSTSIGFTNTLCVVTAPLFQPFVGWILHALSRHSHLGEHDIYTISNYHWALSVIPISLVVATVIAFYLPKHTVSTTALTETHQ